jgi:hypothetical protein
MKKSVLITLLLLFSFTAFSGRTESAPPPPPVVSITNHFSFAIDVTICGTVYTVNPGTVMGLLCSPSPCNFSVKICSTTVNITDPNCGSCGTTSTQYFPAVVSPYCPSFSVNYLLDCSTQNINITINP